MLKARYGKKFQIIENEDESLDVFKTQWYKKIKSKSTPAENMRFYRKLHSMTLSALGERMGNIPYQHISNMEKGIRGISRENAKKLAEIFSVSVEKFI